MVESMMVDAGWRGQPPSYIILSMRIAIGADHAGFTLKEHLKETLTELGHQVDDHGTHSEASVDYPPICAAVGRAVVAGRADRGIVLGGSGQGEQIAANKVRGVRAALCNDLFTARLSRQHNDANVLSMGGRIVAFGLADEILTLWLNTPFEGGRHLNRLKQIAEIENVMNTEAPARRARTSPTPIPTWRRPCATRSAGRTTASS